MGAVAAACCLAAAAPAAADDSVPTAWMQAAGTTPLLHAPPPPAPATICLIDTGVALTPDLNVVARSAADGGTLGDVRADTTSPGHGTAVAHMAAGRVNGWGGAGVFPHAQITSVRVFPREGGAFWQEYIKGLQGCHRLAPETTKVVVMSLGGQTISAGEAEWLESAIAKQSAEKDFSVVVAAGNGGADVDYPGRFGASFTVAASTAAGGVCLFSARGQGVDIAAPGCGLEQAGWDGSAWLLNGTSYAAPIVAGTLAALRAYRPSLSANEAEAVLTATAKRESVPLLDATAALRAAGLAHLVRDAHPPGMVPADAKEVVVPPVVPSAVIEQTPGAVALSAAPYVPKRRRRGAPQLARIARLRAGRVVLRVRNRPRGSSVEVRFGRRRFERRAGRITLRPGATRLVRIRFVSELSASAWVHVRIVR